MNRMTSTFLALALSLTIFGSAAMAHDHAPTDAPAKAEPAKAPAGKEVTLKGMLGCGKCSFQEAKACQNVLKVQDGDKTVSYELADNEVAKANHEKVCGPASPATVTGTVAPGKGKKAKKILTATAITFES
jgi:hypothetical protein